MSAALQPEQDTVLALKLMAMRKTASDTEFAAVLSELLGTCRMEGFRISIQALKLILDEKKGEFGVSVLERARDASHKAYATRTYPDGSVSSGKGEQLPPQIHPLRTREDALAVHKRNHPEMYNADGTRKGFEEKRKEAEQIVGRAMTESELEQATRPDPQPSEQEKVIQRLTRGTVSPETKATLRTRYKNALAQAKGRGLARVEFGFIKRLAAEFGLKVTTVYGILYSDPEIEAVPRA